MFRNSLILAVVIALGLAAPLAAQQAPLQPSPVKRTKEIWWDKITHLVGRAGGDTAGGL